eukprot:CAMPEP_0201869368 /NCGR_PEP_ID=MMETSP0902-20130614/2907_1 /ASSEMBLY_ACC=CAM_ASM_000551 /TAXON_ID=420261 /ORGANISM="Thalassiosira antarctica, Strain CCMP982" /LENGTH=180 /DNA_ID=CAMNT_0048394861 /DNA_START=64 /DNA_END=606 /DNA_ORIENTATION=-
MANAAAKKAAAARESAASTYFPIVVALNLGYLFLRLVYQWNSLTMYNSLITIALLGLSSFSYKGILSDHANPIPNGGKGKSEALAGGASLDLLGLIVLVQYGSIFISEKLYWVLMVIPLWGGWKIYSTFFGSKDGSGLLSGLMPKKNQVEVESTDEDKAAAEEADAKRQKRAEKRRQKRF